MTVPKPVVLCILDGWGHREDPTANAPALADTPNLRPDHGDLSACVADHARPRCRAAQRADGQFRGRPHQYRRGPGGGDGSGPDRSGDRGWQFCQQRRACWSFIETMKASGGTAHLMGLISDGGVHGHHAITSLAAAKVIAEAGVPVRIHAITDGRDVPPKSAPDGPGRACRRPCPTARGSSPSSGATTRWTATIAGTGSRTAYDAMVRAEGHAAPRCRRGDRRRPMRAARPMSSSHATVIDGYNGIRDGDGVFFLNFRADRAREILRAIGDPGFDGFDTGPRPKLGRAAGHGGLFQDRTTPT